MLSLYCIQLNIGQKGLANHFILFLFMFYTGSQCFWKQSSILGGGRKSENPDETQADT